MFRKPCHRLDGAGHLSAVLMLACLGASVVASAPSARAEQGEMTAVVKVPAHIRAVADKVTSNVDWLIGWKFSNYYRLLGKDSHERNVIVDVGHNGAPRGVKTYFTLSGLPAAVRNALKRAQPNFTPGDEPMGVYAMGDTDREILSYRVEGSLPNRKSVTLSITPDGARVTDVELDVTSLKFRPMACGPCGFSIEAPGEATVEDTTRPDGIFSREWTIARGAAKFEISYVNFNGKSPKGHSAYELMRAYRDGAWRGYKFSGERQLVLGQARIPGLEFHVEMPTNYGRVRMFLKNNNELYLLYVRAPKAAVGAQGPLRLADIDRFFNSLTIGPAAAARSIFDASASWTPSQR